MPSKTVGIFTAVIRPHVFRCNEFCVRVDAKPTYNAGLADDNRPTVEYFLCPVTHYHFLNATAAAGVVNAPLAWWYQLWTGYI